MNINSNNIKCVICDAKFKSNNKLKKHVEKIHNLTIKQYFSEHSEAKKYCSKCKLPLPITNFYLDGFKKLIEVER